MRIVYFVGTLEAGGLERFVSRISLKAKREGQFDPIVVCLNKRTGIFLADLEVANVQVYEAPGRWSRSLISWWKLVRLIRSIKPDIVHSQVNFSMLQQFLAARVAGVPFTITERNCYQRRGWALLRRRFQFRFLKLFGVQYSANSIKVADHLANMLHEKAEQFQVLPNGVEVSMRPTSVQTSEKPDSPVRIAYIARMATHKGHLFFLDILEKLLYSRSLKVEAVLIGDGPLRKTIEDTVVQKKLSDYVSFTGVVSNVEDYLIKNDIVCLLSEFEGMPNVVIEAMALGKPVIATDVGNTSELLAGDAGIVLQSRDNKKAVDAFEKLILHRELRISMGDIGKSKISKDFSLASSMIKLVEYYKFLLK